MAVYDFRCENCKKKFTLTMNPSEYSSKKHRCPKCSSTKVLRVYGQFYAVTSKKS